MMRRGLFLLGGLTAALATIIAAELATPAGLDDAAVAATGIRPAMRLPSVDPARDAAPAEDRTDAWVATILGRPLFTRDRRPVGKHETESGSGGDQSLPRLAGIAVSPFGRSAIFAGDTGKPVVVSEGGSVAGFTVMAIHPSTVDIKGPAGTRTLAPAFDPNRKVEVEAPGGGQTDAQGQPVQPGIPQPGFLPQPGFAQPGFPQRGLPVPQFRVPGAPMLPGMRPRVGNGAALEPGAFSRTILTAQAEPPGPVLATNSE